MPPLIQNYVHYLQEHLGDLHVFLSLQQSLSPDEIVELLCWDLEHSWSTKSPKDVLHYRESFPDYTCTDSARMRLALAEYRARNASGRHEPLDSFLVRYPELADSIRAALSAEDQVASVATDLTRSLNETMERGELFCNRYRLERLIGEGAFGEVFQAYDTHLKRRLAIKIPSQRRAENSQYIDRFLEEARTVARLEHPNIVTVYDSGLTPDGRVYVASRWIDGRTLDAKLMEGRIPPRDAARWISVIASALQHAHYLRWIHRDVKPSNILIETATGSPFLADFGLAIREEDFDEHHSGAGTPNYMSPEQARGEGHRLDGRSDQFSLAIVFYELLCGRLPFRGKSLQDLYQQIVSVDPCPPVEINEEVPLELQRICLKALSKRIADRYVKISDMADELDAWLRDKPSFPLPGHAPLVSPKGLRSFDRSDSKFFLDLLPGTRNRDGLPECIAFWKEKLEESDPEKTFPVGLLYGPSGCGKSSLVKAGLLPHLSPSVTAIYVEATPFDTEVRLRRSLEKRLPDLPKEELLPALLAQVRRTTRGKIVLLIDQFEQWLHAHDLNADNELIDALRHCDGGKLQALVMVRDDFAMAASRFMRALEVRIVEGANFAVVDLFDLDHAKMVLTKFGQAYGRLPRPPAVISEDEEHFINDATQGLAKDGKIVSVQLSLFADMVKRKPWNRGTLAQVGGTDGIGVHFLDETFEGRDANPDHRRHAVAARAVLHALLPGSGTDIKGHMRAESDLLDTCGYRSRPGDFKELLTILDGELRLITPTDPEGALSSDSVNRRSSRFDSKSDSSLTSEPGSPTATVSTYYQLTHDFLVPPLRTWLTRKQQETHRGRAELKLTDRTAAWSNHPENKQLPTLWEWGSIRCLTDSVHWTPQQRKMLSRADRFHWSRLAIAFSLLMMLFLGGNWRLSIEEGKRVSDEINKLEVAKPRGNQILEIIRGFEVNPIAFQTELQSRIDATEVGTDDATASTRSENRLKNFVRKLGLMSCTSPKSKSGEIAKHQGYESDLLDTLIGANDEELGNTAEYIRSVRDVMLEYRQPELKTHLASVLSDSKNQEQRFRAALGLAGLDEGERLEPSAKHTWTDDELKLICQQWDLSSVGDETARDLLRPIAKQLLPMLIKTFIETFKDDPAKSKRVAARAIIDFQSQKALSSKDWLDLLSHALDEEFEEFMRYIPRPNDPRRIDLQDTLTKHLREEPSVTEGEEKEAVALGRSQAIAAIALLRMDELKPILPVFDCRKNPESTTQFVDLYPRLGNADPQEKRIQLLNALLNDPTETDPRQTDPELTAKNRASRCYALLLAIGSVVDTLPSTSNGQTLKLNIKRNIQHKVAGLYRNDPSSSVHSASGWLLRRLGSKLGDEIDCIPRPYDQNYEWFRLRIPGLPGCFTFVVFEEEETATSQSGEQAGASNRKFAILDREITNKEMMLLMGDERQTPPDELELAASSVSWTDAIEFCRRLSSKRGISEDGQSYPDRESIQGDSDHGGTRSNTILHPGNCGPKPRSPGFRLPIKVEWLAAAKGGAQTPYSFGSDPDRWHRYAWIQGSSDSNLKSPRPPQQKFPNGRGLFDMQGNVWEWTDEWEWNKDKTSPLVVSRGGSFNKTGSKETLDELVNKDVPMTKEPTVGFRIVLSQEGFLDPVPTKASEPKDQSP
jgi:eukaryotic-like serine/threonine-protein kinase